MGTTLVEELEDAAREIDCLDSECLAAHASCDRREFCAGLRARAAHIRQMQADVEELAAGRIYADGVTPSQIIAGALRVLAGPLPATLPETPGDPREKGQ